MFVPLLVLAGAACSLKPGMSLRRTVDVPGTAVGYIDVTDHLVAALPPVPSALAIVRAPSGCRLALIDPAILAVGPACDVAPRRLWGETVSLAVRDGSPLLPCSARLLVLGDGDPEASWEGGVLDVSIEAADPLLEQQRGAAGGEAFAQAALRTALAAGGADAAAVAALETAEEPSPASRVYETFVARWAEDVHGEALLPAARRADAQTHTAHGSGTRKCSGVSSSGISRGAPALSGALSLWT